MTFDAEAKVLETNWVIPQQLQSELFKKLMSIYFEAVRQYSPKKIFANLTYSFHIITLDVQEWIDENLSPIYEEIKLEKLAVCVSSDLFAQVSVEQTISESIYSVYQTKYFKEEKAAKAWLLEG